MNRIKLTIAYDGTEFCGWQSQPRGRTVEGVLNKALAKVTRERVQVIGASRTDSGVHALGNVAVFDTNSKIPPERMAVAVNQYLPSDVRIMESESVPWNFHPRRCRSVKTYEYYVLNTKRIIPTSRRTNLYIVWPLDVDAMRCAARYLVGRHDFASFCCVRTNALDTVREVTCLEIIQTSERLTFHIEGTGFLYNMVRIIVGTLLRVGRGYYTVEQVKEILEAKDRRSAGVTVPPEGLFLIKIEYEEDSCHTTAVAGFREAKANRKNQEDKNDEDL